MTENENKMNSIADSILGAITERIEAVEAKQKAVAVEYDAVRQDALSACVALCKKFNFTAKELRLAQPDAQEAHKVKQPVKAKYKNPEGPEEWSGRGAKKPEWFVNALAAGYTEADLLIENQQP